MRNQLPFILLSAIFLFGGFSEASAAKPLGPVVTREQSVGGFDALDVSSIVKVVLTQGDVCAVSIKTHENIHDYIEIHVRNGTLHIGVKSLSSFRGEVEITAYVTAPTLKAITISGAGSLTTEAFHAGTPLKIDISGAAKCSGSYLSPAGITLDMSGAASFSGRVDCDGLKMNCSGAAKAKIEGNCRACQVGGSGAVNFRCLPLVYETLRVELSGASNAEFTAIGNPRVSASGVSKVSFKDPSGKTILVKGDS